MQRRQFLQAGVAGAAWLALSPRAYPFAQSPTGLRKFITALPGLTSAGKNELGQYISVATPKKVSLYGQLADAYQIGMVAHSEQLHPSLGATPLWSYTDLTSSESPQYLGGAIVANSGTPVSVQWSNRLPGTHPLSSVIDHTLAGAETGQQENRTVPHLHGGFPAWNSDGEPYAWFTPSGGPVGPSWTPGNYWYPNQQSARLAWYHDHAIALTRLNVYAGLAAAYLLHDTFEDDLILLGLLPPRQFEIPLVIQDKSFQSNGHLWYPFRYEKSSQLPAGSGRWDYGGDQIPPAAPITDPATLAASCVPEFFADTTVINGTVYPYLNVQPRTYRFRILNGSNARFYNLNLYYESASQPGEPDFKRPGPLMVQIGTEGGFLPFPAFLNNPPQPVVFDTTKGSPTFGNVIKYNLLMSPAERADVLIDFGSVADDAHLILYSDAPAPFPGGDPRNDYFTGDPDQTAIGGAPSTKLGFGPNTRTLMQFRVTASPVLAPSPSPLTQVLPSLTPRLNVNFLNDFPSSANLQVQSLKGATGVTRILTLNEDYDNYGRLLQRLGTNRPDPMKNNRKMTTYGLAYLDTPTEIMKAGAVETWQICNLTSDTHPVHFHLVNVMVMGRQSFDADTFNGTPSYDGPFRGPDPNESGWKETVRMNPKEVTTVMMRFNLPQVPFAVPFSPRLEKTYDLAAYEYAWHCHILEHEEHDMMRPLVVTP